MKLSSQPYTISNQCDLSSDISVTFLRLELRGYFINEDGTDTDLSLTPTLAARESEIGEKSQGNAPVKMIVGETVTLSVAVEAEIYRK
ncbi:hypothetical protein PN499_01790 [Kamptonema animale CS-326]|jgi:hypothetical protein|uniref:hypothetical protein n=1 Tax=Kamptonema animale TaxID=92934 RepID=UPI00233043CA|nr:hypothetical protein [Kamptonema animale]MDB9509937.1 hypothetical protein [Kamptonema animale CS-326]